MGSNATIDMVVVKRPKFVDYTIEGEYAALKLVERLNMNHFVRAVDRAGSNLYLEYVEGKMLSVCGLDDQIKINLVVHVLCACACMHEHTGITHYDLHADNVMVRKTDADVVIYKFRENVYKVPTRGYMPVIIDFGYAHIPDDRMYAPLNFTDIGYFPHISDPLRDGIMITCELVQLLNKKKHKQLISKIKAAFKPLPLDCGVYKKRTFVNALERLYERCHGKGDVPSDFEEIIGLFTSQVKLPLVKSTNDVSNRAYADFTAYLNKFSGDDPAGHVKDMLDRGEFQNVTEFINNTLVDILGPVESIIRSMYDKLPVKTVHDIISMLYTEHAGTATDKIHIYDCVSLNHSL